MIILKNAQNSSLVNHLHLFLCDEKHSFHNEVSENDYIAHVNLDDFCTKIGRIYVSNGMGWTLDWPHLIRKVTLLVG